MFNRPGQGLAALFVFTLVALSVISLAQISRQPNTTGTTSSPRTDKPGLMGESTSPPPLAFKPAVAYSTGASFADFVVAADVNGDHKQDLLVGNTCIGNNDCTSGSVAVMLGNGNGTFQPAVLYATGGPSRPAIAVGDVNGDGIPDLVVTNCLTQTDPFCEGPEGAIGVLLGNGDGTFQPAVNYNTAGPDPWSVALADLNGDKKLDLVVANRGSSTVPGSVSVLLGNGDGTFQAAHTFGLLPAFSVAVADVNADDKPDLVVASNDGTVNIFIGKGDGTFDPPTEYGTGGQDTWSVAVMDLNGDGKLDLAVANACQLSGCAPTAQGTVGVLLGNGDGTFQPAVAFPSGAAASVSVTIADLNGDLKPDLLIANSDGNANVGSVTVLVGNGDGSFLPAVTYSSNGEAATSVTAADFNGDGRLDLAVTNLCMGHTHDCNTDGGVSVLLKNVFQPQVKLTTSASPVLVGQSVTFTATVSSAAQPIPDGELVTFYDGASPLASTALAAGTATYSTSALSAKTHSIRATYEGDYNLRSNSKSVSEVVQKYPTTITIQSTPNPSASGQLVTFTAMVQSAGPAPTGKVQIRDGAKGIGTAVLINGKAVFATSKLTLGTHPIVAAYLGDGNSETSDSGALSQIVD
jgi:hypothetical protein